MRPSLLVSVALIAATAGCNDTVRSRGTQAQQQPCDAYLSCLEEIVAKGGASSVAYESALANARVQYGSGGSCAQTPTLRTACDNACAQGLQAARTAYPTIAACGATASTGPGPDAGGPKDGGWSPPDAGNGSGDAGGSTSYGCAGYALCLGNCTASSFSVCMTQCGSMAQSGATAKYDAALACGQNHCLDTGKCILDAAMTSLVNKNGTVIQNTDPMDGSDPLRACGTCLNDSLAQLFNTPCLNPGSPDCNPATCTSVTLACFND